MTLEQALDVLGRHQFVTVTSRRGGVYLSGRWRVSVRLKRGETMAEMMIRLALNVEEAERAQYPPKRVIERMKRQRLINAPVGLVVN